MTEHDLRKLIGDVKSGRVSRRSFLQTALGAGSPSRWPGTC
jgi:hypothetical protein